jgi:hypothetical protein
MAGRFRGGKLAPVMAVPFRESESGVVSQTITFELDPIAGRMITPITAEVVSVYVPAQAIDALKNPEDAYPGNDEVFRQKLLSGNPVFGLEPENEISQRCGIEPRSIGGVKQVNEAVRLAHIAAVNHLRQRKYVKAQLLDSTALTVTPAIIGQTVLDRLNGVLDPEDRVNGAVNFTVPNIKLPVKGLYMHANYGVRSSANGLRESGDFGNFRVADTKPVGDGAGNGRLYVETDPMDQHRPYIFAEGEIQTSEMSLTDFYTAERMDRLTREMRKMVDDNPVYGEELVARFAHGLSLDTGKLPFVIYERKAVFGTSMTRAMDGANLDVVQTNSMVQIPFTVPVPPTEFGGIVITFASVKPDETLEHQPHPILSDNWGARNYVADELAIDPVPVTARDLYADCLPADENNVMLYVGNNHLQKNYVNYGFTRNTDVLTVENKTAVWQIKVPMSVTPESVIYPENLDHYPFADQTAEVVSYNISSVARINTPVIFGPTPVEELAAIETENLFNDNP